MERFDPKSAVESMLDIFRVQAESQGVMLLFRIRKFLHCPIRQGDRSESEVKEMFEDLDTDTLSPNSASSYFPSFMGDQVRLQQILINLVKNAMKFTEQGFIKVSMGYDEASKSLILHIRDSGRGIERSNLGKLFKRFGKLEQEDKSVNKEGIGLGLTICEAIVVQYDGLIEVQSLGLG